MVPLNKRACFEAKRPFSLHAMGKALVPLSLLLAYAVACGSVPQTRTTTHTAALIESAKKKGIRLVDPLAIDQGPLEEVARAVGRWGSPVERLHRLQLYMNDFGRLNFQYVSHLSLTAEEALRERRGDCMAYTNLFMAFARHLGLDTYYVHVSEVLSYYEHKGRFFTSSHVAVGYGSGPSAVVVDLSNEISDWKLAVYRAIDDSAAIALYYNNLAVDAMLSGRMDEAENLLTFLLVETPDVKELYNNLGVLLNQRGRHQEALSVLERGMRAFPTFMPLFTNGIQAARGAGKIELAKQLEQRGQAIASQDPFFLFARGLSYYQSKRYAAAAMQFERAAKEKPDSPVILAWLTRVYMAAGEQQKGRDAFADIRKIAPDSQLLRELVDQFSELQ